MMQVQLQSKSFWSDLIVADIHKSGYVCRISSPSLYFYLHLVRT